MLICSGFEFGDDVRPGLAAFHQWARRDPLITVVPAYFGEPSRTVAAEFATPGAPVVPLNEVHLGRFTRMVSQSVVRASQRNPETGSLAADLRLAVSPAVP